jgi:hypothetical protein
MKNVVLLVCGLLSFNVFSNCQLYSDKEIPSEILDVLSVKGYQLTKNESEAVGSLKVSQKKDIKKFGLLRTKVDYVSKIKISYHDERDYDLKIESRVRRRHFYYQKVLNYEKVLKKSETRNLKKSMKKMARRLKKIMFSCS